jgi:hypothetical protein
VAVQFKSIDTTEKRTATVNKILRTQSAAIVATVILTFSVAVCLQMAVITGNNCHRPWFSEIEMNRRALCQ